MGRLGHDASQGACVHACRRGRVEQTVRFLIPPGGGVAVQFGLPRPIGKGHRLCHGATLPLGQPGAKAPSQRPARRWQALAFVVLGGAGPVETWSLAGRGNAVRFGVRPDWRSLTPKHMGFRFGPAARRKSACTHHKREMIRIAASTHPARFVPTPPHLAKEMRLQVLNSH